MRSEMQTELFAKTRTLPEGIKGLPQRKQLFPTTFFGFLPYMKPGHTYRSQGPVVERHIASSIASPANVLRVSSRILAPLTVTAYKRLLDENKLTSISTAFLMRPETQAELCPKTGTLPEGIKGLLQTKQLFPTTFFGVSAIHEARIWIACSAGVFFGRANILLAKAPCWNSKREEKMGRVKRSGVGGVEREEKTPARKHCENEKHPLCCGNE